MRDSFARRGAAATSDLMKAEGIAKRRDIRFQAATRLEFLPLLRYSVYTDESMESCASLWCSSFMRGRAASLKEDLAREREREAPSVIIIFGGGLFLIKLRWTGVLSLPLGD